VSPFTMDELGCRSMMALAVYACLGSHVSLMERFGRKLFIV
jgi:hypothetical protein